MLKGLYKMRKLAIAGLLSINLFATNVVFVHGLNSDSNTFWTMAKSVAQARGESKVLKIGYAHEILPNQYCYDEDDNNISCDNSIFNSNNTFKIIYGLQPNQFKTKNLYFKELNLTDTNLSISSENIVTDNLKINLHTIIVNLSNNKNLSFESQGKELKIMLNKIKNITDDKDFILVGHSMGGIAIREYMQNYFDNNITVDGIIIIGTPNNGVTTADSIGIAGASGKNLMANSTEINILNSLNLDVYKTIPFIVFRVSGYSGGLLSGDLVSGSDDDGVVAASSQVPISAIDSYVINFKPSCDTTQNCISTGGTIYHSNETKNSFIINEVKKFVTSQIKVHIGWNLVSGNFKKFNLKPIYLAWKYNKNWSSYSNDNSLKSTLLNYNYKIFNEINNTKGLWIYSNKTRELLNINNDYNLSYHYQIGWNLAGTNREINVSDIKCPTQSSNFIVWKYKNNSWQLYSKDKKDFTKIEKNSGFWVDCL